MAEKKMRVPLVILSLMLLPFGHAFACECEPSETSELISGADIIFEGIPTSIREDYQNEYDMLYDFEVDKVWKGNLSENIQIVSGKDDGICGVPIARDRQNIVLAKLIDGRYHTSSCSGTGPEGANRIIKTALANTFEGSDVSDVTLNQILLPLFIGATALIAFVIVRRKIK